MKIAHISHTDAGAGAGRAAYRIHRSLVDLGEDSQIFVSNKRTTDPTVISVTEGALPRLRSKLNEYGEAKLSQHRATPGAGLFSPARFGHFNPANDPRIATADIISLYWIAGGFVSPEQLSGLKQPIVWRLSDVWPFTGGCHYPSSCERYTQTCGECPQLTHPACRDVSHRLIERKQQAWHDLNLTIAAPSEWMASLARKSTLFANRRIKVIPTGVDTDIYSPLDRALSRLKLGIPQDKIVLLFGAMDTNERRKGYAELSAALEILAQGRFKDKLQAVVFGSSNLSQTQLSIPTIFLGKLNEDDMLAAAYSLADIVVVPSLEDNLPNVALEAIACGTPVVGFDVCGMKDIVRTGWNGALADTVQAKALAFEIENLLMTENLPAIAANARAHAISRFSLTQQANSYLNLYRELVSNHRQGSPTHMH